MALAKKTSVSREAMLSCVEPRCFGLGRSRGCGRAGIPPGARVGRPRSAALPGDEQNIGILRDTLLRTVYLQVCVVITLSMYDYMLFLLKGVPAEGFPKSYYEWGGLAALLCPEKERRAAGHG